MSLCSDSSGIAEGSCQAHESRIASRETRLGRQRRTDERFTICRSIGGGPPWKRQNRSSTPYTRTRPRDVRSTCAVTSASMHDQRTDSGKSRCERRIAANVVRERLAKEARRRHDEIGRAETIEGKIAQRAAHRIANDQGAGQDRDGRRDARRRRQGWCASSTPAREGRGRRRFIPVPAREAGPSAELVANRETLGHRGAVRDDDQDVLLLAMEIEEHGRHVDAAGASRLPVGSSHEQEPRAPNQRTGDGHALPLAARQLAGR